ncbi:ATP-binding protein [Mycolicibacterium sp.]|uniref:sensor histidine kinase n=1 Tax=Mycolicibacterium sp. TaxID=2320850 RepID=UPI001A2B8E77|nr:ATP-binding protein [Mycolicibacterium sp.]MBJ7341589.1 ATP-binding protein [Mycolicibacterium sp.]
MVTADASQRHLASRAARIGVIMRHTANLLVAIVVLANHQPTVGLPGRLLVGVLGAWAIHRLVTRSLSPAVTAIDLSLVIAVCLAIPWLVDGPGFFLTNSAPVAVAGTAVISFAVALPVRWSFVTTLVIAASYAVGSASVLGWSGVSDVFNLYYFGLQWGTCAWIRIAELRVASAVDDARARRQSAEVTQRVTSAVREYDREQLRVLHDTVASTLLLVGQGSSISPDRLARQARRDLDVLTDPLPESREPIELVCALADLVVHLRTAARFTGVETLWVDAHTGRCLIAVTREALNNVDRHARAETVTLDVAPQRIVITDDGVGFDTAASRLGYGLAQSMTARMRTLGGGVAVSSSPGNGTTITVTWLESQQSSTTTTPGVHDPDRLIDRTRTGYGLSLSAYAVISLASMTPAAFGTTGSAAQIVLASAAILLTLVAVPRTLRKRANPGIAPAALLAVALAQTALLPSESLGSGAQWSQAAIGWCILPFLLREPVRRAAAQLLGAWIILGAFTFLREPTAQIAVNLGLGTASILTVQLCALLFSGLISDAAAEAHAELNAQTALAAAHRIASAVQIEYRRRYAKLLVDVRPILESLRDGRPVDDVMRRRARTESLRLRALFGQSATFDHPLMAELRSGVDDADDRGVDVSLDVRGTLPATSESEAADIAAPLLDALAGAETTARVTILVADGVLIASVVCDHAVAAGPTRGSRFGADVEVVDLGDTAWITVRRRLDGARSSHASDTRPGASVDLHHR